MAGKPSKLSKETEQATASLNKSTEKEKESLLSFRVFCFYEFGVREKRKRTTRVKKNLREKFPHEEDIKLDNHKNSKNA